MIFRNRQHPARPAARIIDGYHDALSADAVLVAREKQVGHEMDDVARREVFAGILVQGFVELPDQLLEDRSHGRVIDLVGVEVHVLEALQHLEEEPRLVELGDGVVEIELFEDFAHVRAEAGDVVPQVRGQVGRIGQELFEIVAGGVVKGEAGGLAKLGVGVFELLVGELVLGFEDLLLGRGQDAVEPPQDRKRQDHVLILAAFERVADEVGDTPDEADDFAMVQSISSSAAGTGPSSRGISGRPSSCFPRGAIRRSPSSGRTAACR